MKLTAYATEIRLRQRAANLHAMTARHCLELTALTVIGGMPIEELEPLVSECAESHFSARDLEMTCDAMREQDEERIR